MSHPSAPLLVSRTLVILLAAGMCLRATLPAAEPAASAPSSMTANPLLTESTLPYHLPPFDQVKDEHYAPAFEQGMAQQLTEVAAIADNPQPPTFENTIVALERSGQLLDRVEALFSNLSSAHTNPAMQAVEREMAPKLAAHSDAIRLNSALFARVHELYQARAELGLNRESLWLLERYHLDFVRAGARLSETDKTQLKALNAEIASLQTTFAQNVLKEKNADSLIVDSRAELAGLSESEIAAAATAGGKPGRFALALLNTTGQPLLAQLQNRAVRERLMQVSLARGSHGGPFDNRETVARLVRLRAERAVLLGYASHADYQLEDQTARTVRTVNQLLADLAPAAVANARREAAEMQGIIDREKGGFQLAASDWESYAEKLRAARYAFDESQLKPYLELDHVLQDGVFYAAHRLYGLSFKERHDLPVYQPDVRVFEVFDADGSPLALFLADYYARPSKRGGAWMNRYVSQSELLGLQPVVANHLNIPKPPAGQPTLLTFDEVTTAFHEFGHALHGMLSHVKYPRFSGTNVPRDFVEYPSQANEMWATWPDVVKNYAKHYQTGEPMPAALLDKMLATQKFDQGYKTTEQLAATLLDQAWYQLKPAEVPGADGVLAFEAAALHKAGVDFAPVPPRYRSTYFSHAFAGGYSAGYYSYLWSEVLAANTVEWFKLHGGLTRENGDRYRKHVLSRGGSQEAMSLFRNFTGSEPQIEPLLKRRGLELPAGARKSDNFDG
jgi:peptidyl-dipeptidase Dcp